MNLSPKGSKFSIWAIPGKICTSSNNNYNCLLILIFAQLFSIMDENVSFNSWKPCLYDYKKIRSYTEQFTHNGMLNLDCLFNFRHPVEPGWHPVKLFSLSISWNWNIFMGTNTFEHAELNSENLPHRRPALFSQTTILSSLILRPVFSLFNSTFRTFALFIIWRQKIHLHEWDELSPYFTIILSDSSSYYFFICIQTISGVFSWWANITDWGRLYKKVIKVNPS
jgi:hypothetical protein